MICKAESSGLSGKRCHITLPSETSGGMCMRRNRLAVRRDEVLDTVESQNAGPFSIVSGWPKSDSVASVTFSSFFTTIDVSDKGGIVKCPSPQCSYRSEVWI